MRQALNREIELRLRKDVHHRCTNRDIGRQGIVLEHRISLRKSQCPVVICPYLCSSECGVRLAGSRGPDPEETKRDPRKLELASARACCTPRLLRRNGTNFGKPRLA